MRTFELLIVIAVFSYALWLSSGTGLPTSIFRLLPFLAAVLVAVQLLVEGARWQLYPLYLLVLLALASYAWCRARSFRIGLRYITIGWAVNTAFLASSCVAAGVLWPVFEFSPLTGSYPVGCVDAHLVDHHRTDPYAKSTSDPRELMIEIWYPAETTTGYPRARFRDGRTRGFNESSLALVKTRSFVSAPIATNRPAYPVLLFSGPVNRFQNTFEVEEMASNGFIVIGIDHPYDSDLVIFPDGRRVYRNDQTGYLDYTSEAAYQRSKKLIERRLAVRVADAQFVLDQLENWNDRDRSSRFFGRIDTRHTGIFGHSFGGAEAAELCRVDSRVGAGVNMDGTIFGMSKAEGIPKPYLVMFEGTGRPTRAELETGSEMARQQARDDEQDYDDVELTLNRYGGYFLQVPGVSHMDFTDYTLISQLKAQSGAGTLNVRRVHEMINRVTLEFFRRELLRDQSASVETAVRNYPETLLTDKIPSVDRNKQWE